MTADKVVLQLDALVVLYFVLRHRAETCIDPVNNFIFRKFFQKVETVLNSFYYIFVKLDGFVFENDFIKIGCFQFSL